MGKVENFNLHLSERCEILSKLIKNIIPLYSHKEITANQKKFVETIIGAAIWYLPQDDRLWTGKISKAAIESFRPSVATNPKLTIDHEFPRKIAASELLNLSWDNESKFKSKFLKLYYKKYGKFSYITPLENRKLVRYQKKDVFISPAESYKRAKIRLIKINKLQLMKIRSGDFKTIKKLLSKNRKSEV